MALNQYTFIVIPKVSFDNSFSELRLKKEGDFFDDSFFWAEEQVECIFFDRISLVLPMGESWSNDLVVFGDIKSNCFKVLCNHNKVISVSFRIDFTTNYSRLLSEVVEFCITNALLIIDEDMNIIPHNSLSIQEVINNSRQFKLYYQLKDNMNKR
jgi:hypothetical protein